jgi:hypothetical protein
VQNDFCNTIGQQQTFGKMTHAKKKDRLAAVSPKPNRIFGSGACALGFFDLKVASDSIEHGHFSLLDRCDGVVDGERGVFVQQLGIIRGAFNVQIVLPLGYFRFQIVHVSGDFRFHSIPLGGRRIASGLDVLVDLLDRFLSSSLRLRNASNDFILGPAHEVHLSVRLDQRAT